MRLTESSGSQLLPHDMYGKAALKDMQKLYGGRIERTVFMGERQDGFTTANGSVRAYTKGRHPTITNISNSNLQSPANAARWTALQAYSVRLPI